MKFCLQLSHRINSQSAALSSLRLDDISANFRFPAAASNSRDNDNRHVETSARRLARGASADSGGLLGRRVFRLTLLLLLVRQLAARPSSGAARMNALGKLTYAGD